MLSGTDYVDRGPPNASPIFLKQSNEWGEMIPCVVFETSAWSLKSLHFSKDLRFFSGIN